MHSFLPARAFSFLSRHHDTARRGLLPRSGGGGSSQLGIFSSDVQLTSRTQLQGVVQKGAVNKQHGAAPPSHTLSCALLAFQQAAPLPCLFLRVLNAAAGARARVSQVKSVHRDELDFLRGRYERSRPPCAVSDKLGAAVPGMHCLRWLRRYRRGSSQLRTHHAAAHQLGLSNASAVGN